MKEARAYFRSSLSAFEFLDKNAQGATFRAFPEHAPRPFESQYPFAVLIEIEAYNEEDEADLRLLKFIEQMSENIKDGVIAQDKKQFD